MKIKRYMETVFKNKTKEDVSSNGVVSMFLIKPGDAPLNQYGMFNRITSVYLHHHCHNHYISIKTCTMAEWFSIDLKHLNPYTSLLENKGLRINN